MSNADGCLASDAHSNSAKFVIGDAENNRQVVDSSKSKLRELLKNANYKPAAVCEDTAFCCFLQELKQNGLSLLFHVEARSNPSLEVITQACRTRRFPKTEPTCCRVHQAYDGVQQPSEAVLITHLSYKLGSYSYCVWDLCIESFKILCYRILPVLIRNNDVPMRALGHDVLCLISLGGFSSEAECHCGRVNGVWSMESVCEACRGGNWFGGDQFHRLQWLMCKALVSSKALEDVGRYIGFREGRVGSYIRNFRQESSKSPLNFRYYMAKGEGFLE